MEIMARVVMITPYFWPDITANVPLMTSLCQDMVEYGHEVTVLTSVPGRGIDDDARKAFINSRQTPEYYFCARIIRFPNPFMGKLGTAAKFFEYLVYTVCVLAAAFVMAGRTDVFYIYSNPPLIGWPVYVATRWGRSSIIYNLQDLFPDSAFNNGQISNHRLLRVLKRMERATYRSASVVTVISEAFVEHVHTMLPKTRVVLLPNWIDLQKMKFIRSNDNEFLKSNGLMGSFNVVYAGNLGFAQNMDIIVETAKLLKDETSIQFIIVGEGQQKQYLKDLSHNHKLDNIHFFPFQPEKLVAHVYSAGAVGLVSMKPGTGHSSVPSKTWAIMACERPVIACLDKDSDLATVINDSRSGIVVSAKDPVELAEAIKRLYKDPDLSMQLGKNGRYSVEENIGRQAVTKRYCELVEELVPAVSYNQQRRRPNK